MSLRFSSAFRMAIRLAESPPASECVAGALAVATAPGEAHSRETGEADAEHCPGGGLGNRERRHVAVDGEFERAETARARDLDEVGPGLLVVSHRGERAD